MGANPQARKARRERALPGGNGGEDRGGFRNQGKSIGEERPPVSLAAVLDVAEFDTQLAPPGEAIGTTPSSKRSALCREGAPPTLAPRTSTRASPDPANVHGSRCAGYR
jgi:hypothetical protein